MKLFKTTPTGPAFKINIPRFEFLCCLMTPGLRQGHSVSPTTVILSSGYLLRLYKHTWRISDKLLLSFLVLSFLVRSRLLVLRKVSSLLMVSCLSSVSKAGAAGI